MRIRKNLNIVWSCIRKEITAACPPEVAIVTQPWSQRSPECTAPNPRGCGAVSRNITLASDIDSSSEIRIPMFSEIPAYNASKLGKMTAAQPGLAMLRAHHDL
jgi:hypothetical protein